MSGTISSIGLRVTREGVVEANTELAALTTVGTKAEATLSGIGATSTRTSAQMSALASATAAANAALGAGRPDVIALDRELSGLIQRQQLMDAPAQRAAQRQAELAAAAKMSATSIGSAQQAIAQATATLTAFQAAPVAAAAGMSTLASATTAAKTAMATFLPMLIILGAVKGLEALFNLWAKSWERVAEQAERMGALADQRRNDIASETQSIVSLARETDHARQALLAYQRGGERALEIEEDRQRVMDATRAELGKTVHEIDKYTDANLAQIPAFQRVHAQITARVAAERAQSDAVAATRRAQEAAAQAEQRRVARLRELTEATRQATEAERQRYRDAVTAAQQFAQADTDPLTTIIANLEKTRDEQLAKMRAIGSELGMAFVEGMFERSVLDVLRKRAKDAIDAAQNAAGNAVGQLQILRRGGGATGNVPDPQRSPEELAAERFQRAWLTAIHNVASRGKATFQDFFAFLAEYADTSTERGRAISESAPVFGAFLGLADVLTDLADSGRREAVAAREAAEALKQLNVAARNSASAYHLQAVGTPLEQTLAQLKQQFLTLYQELAKAGGFNIGDHGGQRITIEDLQQAEEDYNRLVEAAKRAAEFQARLGSLDLDARLAAAQGRDAEADAIRRQIEHERELEQARLAGADATTLARIAEVQAAEDAKRAIDEAADRQRTMENLQAELLRLQGDDQGATAIERQHRLADAADDAQRAILLLIFGLQDTADAAKAAANAARLHADAIETLAELDAQIAREKGDSAGADAMDLDNWYARERRRILDSDLSDDDKAAQLGKLDELFDIKKRKLTAPPAAADTTTTVGSGPSVTVNASAFQTSTIGQFDRHLAMMQTLISLGRRSVANQEALARGGGFLDLVNRGVDNDDRQQRTAAGDPLVS